MNFIISPREANTINIALTLLYDEIGKKGGGKFMKTDIMNLARRLNHTVGASYRSPDEVNVAEITSFLHNDLLTNNK